MRHVEDARGFPHRAVFLEDAGVLHGQIVARKFHHLAAEGDVCVEKRSPLCHISS